MILLRVTVILYKKLFGKEMMTAAYRTFRTVSEVDSFWWHTLSGWPESPTRHWLKHRIQEKIGKYHRIPRDQFRSLAYIRVHRDVVGVTHLGNCIYVVCENNPIIEKYSELDLKKMSRFAIEDLRNPRDVVSCDRSASLYILSDDGIWRWNTDNKHQTLLIQKPFPGSMSMRDSKLLVSWPSQNTLSMYNYVGYCIHHVSIASYFAITHAVETCTSTILACHRLPQSGVSELDVDGRILRVCTYDLHFDRPVHFTMVDETHYLLSDRSSVMLIDTDRLEAKNVGLTTAENIRGRDENDSPISDVSRLCYMPSTGRLLVVMEKRQVELFEYRPSLG